MNKMAAPANFIRLDHLNCMRLARHWTSLGLGNRSDSHIFHHLCASVDYQKKYCFDAALNRVVNEGYLSELLGYVARYVRSSLMRLEQAGLIVVLKYRDSMNIVVHPYIASSGDVFDEHLRLFSPLDFLTRPNDLVFKSGICEKAPERWNWQAASELRKWSESRKRKQRAFTRGRAINTTNAHADDLLSVPKVLGDYAVNTLGDDSISTLGDDAVNTLGDDSISTLGDDAVNTLGANKHIRDNIQGNNIQENNIGLINNRGVNKDDLEARRKDQERKETSVSNRLHRK